MEIEGIINHVLRAAELERELLEIKITENDEHLEFWKNIKQIQAHEELKSRLERISHIRQILGSEDFMLDMIKQEPDAPSYFMGFPLKTIEFYLHMRDSLVEHE